MKKIRFSRKQLVIPYALFLILFVILPLLLIVYYAFTIDNHFSFVNFGKFFTDATKINTLLISLVIGALNTIICLLIGYPIAYLLANKKYNSNKVIVMLFIMPMWINFVLRTAATRDLLTAIGIKGGNMPYLADWHGLQLSSICYFTALFYNVKNG